jgi:DNA repair protein RecO (recombination protein O)
MSRNPRRVQLTPGYVLHHRPYRDTSRILEVITREYGRLSLFARGVRGPKAKLAALLQPFRLLLLSWSGRGEAPQLTGAESGGGESGLPSRSLMPAFYLNELLLKLTTRHDPLPTLFDAYHEALSGLRSAAPLDRTLRLFEKHLLEATGYGLELAIETQSGRSIDGSSYYQFRPSQGLFLAVADAPGAIAGTSVLALAAEELADQRSLDDSRRILQSALGELLEGRELATRTVARAVARRVTPASTDSNP